jgi:hypothetical protein
VCSTLFLFRSYFCHHGSGGGAAIDSAPSQEEPYVSPCKDIKLLACLVQELWCSKVGAANCAQ